MQNNWIASDSVDSIQELDAKYILIEKIRKNLNSTDHDFLDLASREKAADFGGLCGIASLFKALYDTILTLSQLKLINYDTMREIILNKTLMRNESFANVSDLNDMEILRHYYQCKFSIPALSIGSLFLLPDLVNLRSKNVFL